MEQRIETDKYFMEIATTVAKRSTCLRRSVGCVLVDSKNHIVATGYNGVPKGFDHCLDSPCKGAFSESGTDLDLCSAIHAEVNAILNCCSKLVNAKAYITTRPCFNCTLLMWQAGVKHIIFASKWSTPKMIDEDGDYWKLMSKFLLMSDMSLIAKAEVDLSFLENLSSTGGNKEK